MKESLYFKSRNRLTKLKNTGFDYKGKLFRKSMSPLLFADPKRAEILDEYEKIMYFLVEKTKFIKTFYNYTVNKDYKNLN